MKTEELAKKFQDDFIRSWQGEIPENIQVLLNAILEKAINEGSYNVNLTVDENKDSLLHHIVRSYQDKTNAIKILLKHGADINQGNLGKNTPLCEAVIKFSMNGSYNYVSFLIEMGADVNRPNVFGHTPLHAACELIDYGHHNSRPLIPILLEKGAKVALLDNEETNVYEIFEEKIEDIRKGRYSDKTELAEFENCFQLVEIYFDKEKEVATEKMRNLMKEFQEIWKNNPCTVVFQRMNSKVKEGIFDINLPDGLGVSLLHYAACRKKSKIVQLLVMDYGADVNVQVNKDLNLEERSVNFGYSPLHCVLDPLSFGFKKWDCKGFDSTARFLIAFLLQHGADINLAKRKVIQ